MSTAQEALQDVLGRCPTCQRAIGSHHQDGCQRWGQVLPSECPGYIESVARDVLAKRELDEKIAAAREEQREACAREAQGFIDDAEGGEMRAVASVIRETPLTFTPLAIRIEELKSDLNQAAHVCGELAHELEAMKDDKQLLQKLLQVLSREVGKTGLSEGAVDVAERIIRERNEARAELDVERRDGLTAAEGAQLRAELAAEKKAHLETERARSNEADGGSHWMHFAKEAREIIDWANENCRSITGGDEHRFRAFLDKTKHFTFEPTPIEPDPSPMAKVAEALREEKAKREVK